MNTELEETTKQIYFLIMKPVLIRATSKMIKKADPIWISYLLELITKETLEPILSATSTLFLDKRTNQINNLFLMNKKMTSCIWFKRKRSVLIKAILWIVLEAWGWTTSCLKRWTLWGTIIFKFKNRVSNFFHFYSQTFSISYF